MYLANLSALESEKPHYPQGLSQMFQEPHEAVDIRFCEPCANAETGDSKQTKRVEKYF